jgi:CBS domain-containing protein
MKALDVGALPVCDHDRLVGMLTDRDITIRAVSRGNNPSADSVRNAMTPEVFFCFEDQDVQEAAGLMREKQVRRLPVLNRDKRLVGIISLGDVALDCNDPRLTADALEGVSQPYRPER